MINPLDRCMMASIIAVEALIGKDNLCMKRENGSSQKRR